MKRGGPLRRRTSLKRGKPLRSRSTKPSARARRVRQFGPQAALCRLMACSCGCDRGPCDPHHEPPRSVGGTDEDTLPLYRECHEERHRVGAAKFWESRGVDPEKKKARLRAEVMNG